MSYRNHQANVFVLQHGKFAFHFAFGCCCCYQGTDTNRYKTTKVAKYKGKLRQLNKILISAGTSEKYCRVLALVDILMKNNSEKCFEKFS